jgi:xanthine dehydrogenase molybdopterin-binding subunit B
MAKAKQTEMFEQGKIPTIEKYADVFDEKRALIAGLTGERNNAELKLAEAMHKNADKVQKEGGDLIYVRGDYKVIVKQGKETVNVKIKDAAKGTEPGADEPANDEDEPAED